MDRQEFAACLLPWAQALHEASGGKLLAIDGQALRRSARKRPGLGLLPLVTAWSGDNGLTLAQAACDDKSSEITAIPELWKPLSLKGCTVTIDRHRRNAVVGLPTGDRPANPRAEGA